MSAGEVFGLVVWAVMLSWVVLVLVAFVAKGFSGKLRGRWWEDE